MNTTPIRDAATIILVRDAASAPKILMGQRGSTAAFMPNKFVFPGGAVDPDDGTVPFAASIALTCEERLRIGAGLHLAPALAGAAIRELWEEAGLILGAPGTWHDSVPDDWQSFAASGNLPRADALHYVFRAITPPGRPRRFDARFFLADAAHLANDPDDFSAATDELSHLQWIPLTKARSFNLPFITEVVLAEVASALPHIGPPSSVPFFNNSDEESLFERLGGQGPLR